jgi:hypothetical protein
VGDRRRVQEKAVTGSGGEPVANAGDKRGSSLRRVLSATLPGCLTPGARLGYPYRFELIGFRAWVVSPERNQINVGERWGGRGMEE